MKNSARRFAATLILGIVMSGPWATAQAQTNSDLLGGWIIASWEAPDGQTGPDTTAEPVHVHRVGKLQHHVCNW